MSAKPLDLQTINTLLEGKSLNKPKRPRAHKMPQAQFSFEQERPAWHKWVYGGQRNPLL